MSTVHTFAEFERAFRRARVDGYYSPGALRALWERYQEDVDEAGAVLDLNPLRIACTFTEYGSARCATSDYGCSEDDFRDDAEAADWLNEQTVVLQFPGGVVVQDFDL